jgi:hypothetical protein
MRQLNRVRQFDTGTLQSRQNTPGAHPRSAGISVALYSESAGRWMSPTIFFYSGFDDDQINRRISLNHLR